MLLALNIGNSNITFGGYAADGKRAFSSRLYADPALSSDELTYKMVNMLALYGIAPADLDAIILASVVPAITPRMREALHKISEAPLMEVGPGLKSGVRIRMDQPAQLGGELLCAVVAALRLYDPPLIVLHADTANTLLAVDDAGSLLGGAILPGPQLSLASLVRNTAQLPQVELESHPKQPVGSNTAACLQSGIVFGTACQLDGMIARIRAQLNAPLAPVVATGALPQSIRDACATPLDYRESLVLDGLYHVWQKNIRKAPPAKS